MKAFVYSSFSPFSWSCPDLTDIREVGNNPREDVHHGKERATTETIFHAGVQG
jgi:hypothetical protein